MTSDDISTASVPSAPDAPDSAMATGSDTGSPGESSTIPPEPGDDAVREQLLQDGSGDPVTAAEDDAGMADAVDDDGPARALAVDGGPDPESPVFQEPGAG